MKATDLIKMALDLSLNFTLPLFEDMRDQPLAAPTPKGGNHPVWLLGHLTFSEGQIVQEWMQGKQNPAEAWRELFKGGTQPMDDASKYPSFDEVLEKFKQIRAGTMELVSTLSDADLDKPSAAPPPEFDQFFRTYGECLLGLSLHWMNHRGQIANCRHAVGREPMIA